MATIKNLLSLNFVFIAKNPIVSNYTQYWFVKNNIFSEDEILPNSFFSPYYVHLVSKDTEIMIQKEKIVFYLKTDSVRDSLQVVSEKLSNFIRCSVVPMEAVGINIIKSIYDDSISISELTKKIFFNKELPIANFFDTDDACFGVYFSKKIDDLTRLKLDIKPKSGKIEGRERQFIMATFNYHCLISNDEQLQEILLGQIANLEKYLQISEELICLLN